MRTRTLLLLAVVCGLAILVAGVIQLLRLGDAGSETRAVDVGALVTVGDMAVTVENLDERPGSLLVAIEIGGVDDPDGTAAFKLVVPGESRALLADPTAGDHCGPTTVQVQPCTLAFRLPDEPGSSRVLLYRRGDEQVSWAL